jgi:hypothetical protein
MLRAALVGSLVMLLPCATRAAEPLRLTVGYEITMSGLPAGLEHIEAELAPDGYAIEAHTSTSGLIDTFVHFRSAARTTGRFEAGAPQPITHDAQNRWRGKDRHVHLNYLAGGLEADVAPSADKDRRETVPEEMRPGTVDPITAALRLMEGAASEVPCVQRIAVFDGRRRYDLAATDGGLQPLEGAGKGVPVRVCRVAYVGLAGRTRNPFWPRSREPREAEIWFAVMDPRLPPVAVLVKAMAGPIPMRIRLTALAIDGVDLLAARGSASAAEPVGN